MNLATPKRRILFRCDGTAQTGLGHVSRCLALAEALEELDCTCWFAGHFGPAATALLAAGPHQQIALTQRSGSREDCAETAGLAGRLAVHGLVLDSYAAGLDFVETLARETPPLLVLDDFGALASVRCAALLNFTVGATGLGYPETGRLNLLGPEYFLARRRLRALRGRRSPRRGQPVNVCVAIGGFDRYDAAAQVLAALAPWARRSAVRVVVSRDTAPAPALETLTARFLPTSGVCRQPADLADELAWADVCICGGGLVKYEAAYVGVPPAVLSQTEAQAGETVAFAARGLALDLGLAATVNPAKVGQCLRAWMDDQSSLDAVRAKGLATFPNDPTQQAAETFLRVLNR